MTLTTDMTLDLDALFDSRQSFYGKARVTLEGTDKHLTSYSTRVATITGENEVILRNAWDSSATTLRHVKEFLKQHGFTAESKAQIAKDYA